MHSIYRKQQNNSSISSNNLARMDVSQGGTTRAGKAARVGRVAKVEVEKARAAWVEEEIDSKQAS